MYDEETLLIYTLCCLKYSVFFFRVSMYDIDRCQGIQV